MAFVILQNCCKDASCVAACPVNCIHPAPGQDDGYAAAPMLYVDPRVCIDCGACADACPVDAVVPADTLHGPEQAYAEINAEHFAGTPVETSGLTPDRPTFRSWTRPDFDWSLPSDFAPLDVAVVGTGPAGMYAAEHLLLHTASRVTLVDRLPVAGGLVRYGVAPDHPGTKRIGETFARMHSHPRVRMLLGAELGTDVSLAQLAEHVDAVVLATGAAVGRRLGVPGEDLPDSLTGPELVGWYNGHPDVPASAVRLDRERAVVVGTGNVALDIARILSVDPEVLAGTDLADHALAELRRSAVREVVLLARRGPEDAAYTAPELRALTHLAGVELVVDENGGGLGSVGSVVGAAQDGDHAALLRGVARRRVDLAGAPEPGRRIVLRFGTQVSEIRGADRVEAVVLDDGTVVPTGLLVTSIGYRARPVPGLPYDEELGTVPHDRGRVDGVPGAYVVGWAKRGSSGGIGDNRTDAAETVRTLLDDAVSGRLGSRRRGARGSRALTRAVRKARPDVVEAADLARIERAERDAGTTQGRPRVKLTTDAALRAAARRR